jgi:hypothetical protein
MEGSVLSISGSGQVTRDCTRKLPQFRTIVVQEGITALGVKALQRQRKVASLSLPDSLVRIACFALSNKPKLTRLSLPPNLAHIAESAFEHTAISELVLSPFMGSITLHWIRAMKNLSSIDISGDSPHYELDSGVLFTKGRTRLHRFPPRRSCGSYVTPPETEMVSPGAFCDCDIQKVSLPGVIEIDPHSFKYCRSLSSISLSPNLSWIGGYAFWGCALESISLPDRLMGIDRACFGRCQNLTAVFVPNSVVLLEASLFLISGVATVSIGGNVSYVHPQAFDGAAMLTRVETRGIVGANVSAALSQMTKRFFTLVFDHRPEGIAIESSGGAWMSLPTTPTPVPPVQECDGMEYVLDGTTLKISGGGGITRPCVVRFHYWSFDTRWDDGGEVIFAKQIPFVQGVIVADGVSQIEDSAFEGETALEAVFLPASIVKIPQRAFNGCSNLSKCDLPDGLREIGFWAFRETSLRRVTIPPLVEMVAPGAFSSAGALARFDVSPVNKFYVSDERGILWTKNQSVLVAYPAGAAPRRLLLEDRAEAIAGYAFEHCRTILGVEMRNVSRIGGEAFSFCSNLSEVVLSEGLTKVSHDAFRECLGLVSITVPRSVRRLAPRAFDSCRNLAEVELSEGLIELSRGVFWNCTSLRMISLPDSITTIRHDAFADSGLEAVILPGQVANISRRAFASCPSLFEVRLRGTPSSKVCRAIKKVRRVFVTGQAEAQTPAEVCSRKPGSHDEDL